MDMNVHYANCADDFAIAAIRAEIRAHLATDEYLAAFHREEANYQAHMAEVLLRCIA